jgi:hypothetical protein
MEQAWGDLNFEWPIQTIKAVSKATGISRFTLAQACRNGLFGIDAYKSEGTWLINTKGEHFRRWLAAYPTQHRVKDRLARQQEQNQTKG